MRPRALITGHGKAAVVASLLVALVLVGAFLTTARQPQNSFTATGQGAPLPTSTATAPTPGPSGGTGTGADQSGDVLAGQVSRLRALSPVVSPPGAAKITGDASQQPDLYAAEFVRRLLTQDYRQPRRTYLEWVQAESASTREPLVVGKVPPELRDRLAVFTVTDANGGPTPIPSPGEWDGLAVQRGYQTASIDRVEEPFAWTNAVASGRITDPGVTARDVSATVTRHTFSNGHDATATFSVAVTVNLEGPPARRDFGFVAVISYTSIQVS